jgi:hypothetical protein
MIYYSSILQVLFGGLLIYVHKKPKPQPIKIDTSFDDKIPCKILLDNETQTDVPYIGLDYTKLVNYFKLTE